MIYLFCILLGVGLAVFAHYELERLRTWGSTELAKLAKTLEKN